MADRRTDGEPRVAEYQRLYLDGAIDGVALVAADGAACTVCAAVADRVYVPSHLPPIPVAGCTRRDGCRCHYEPSFTVYE